ncbi:MAG: HTTM domain-containing protein, partial [Bacteroidota bacterium]
MNRFKDAYFQNIDASGLGLFRMLFGLVLCLQGLEFLRLDFVTKDIVQPILHFPFQGFEFLPILSESALTLMVAGLAIAGLFVAAGLFYRFALGYYFLVFTYLWLLDKGYFNNHYYLLSILCGIMLLLDADRWKPWKKKRNGENVGREWIPAWQVLALKVMLLIVFSWAGLNKLQSGWLVNHQPIAHIMDVKSQVTGGEWNGDLLVGFLIYGGALFDLSIIPLLWWKKTRFYAMFALIFFNVF